MKWPETIGRRRRWGEGRDRKEGSKDVSPSPSSEWKRRRQTSDRETEKKRKGGKRAGSSVLAQDKRKTSSQEQDGSLLPFLPLPPTGGAGGGGSSVQYIRRRRRRPAVIVVASCRPRVTCTVVYVHCTTTNRQVSRRRAHKEQGRLRRRGSRGIAHAGVKEKKGPVCLLALREGGTEKRVCVGVDKDEDGKKADAGRRQEEEGGWISCMRRREESPK